MTAIYNRNLREARAFAEGAAGNPAANPHPVGSPAADAYDAGAAQTVAGDCGVYQGVAECSLPGVTPTMLSGALEPTPASFSVKPTSANTKAEIEAYLLAEGWHVDELTGKTKAQLLEMV